MQMMTPLHVACAHGSKNVARCMLQGSVEEFDIYAQSKESFIPLHLAAAGGHDTIAKLLVNQAQIKDGKNGIKKMLQCRDCENNSPLLLAIENGQFETVKFLLQQVPPLSEKPCTLKNAIFQRVPMLMLIV